MVSIFRTGKTSNIGSDILFLEELTCQSSLHTVFHACADTEQAASSNHSASGYVRALA